MHMGNNTRVIFEQTATLLVVVNVGDD
jgi:hypothetical protein